MNGKFKQLSKVANNEMIVSQVQRRQHKNELLDRIDFKSTIDYRPIVAARNNAQKYKFDLEIEETSQNEIDFIEYRMKEAASENSMSSKATVTSKSSTCSSSSDKETIIQDNQSLMNKSFKQGESVISLASSASSSSDYRHSETTLIGQEMDAAFNYTPNLSDKNNADSVSAITASTSTKSGRKVPFVKEDVKIKPPPLVLVEDLCDEGGMSWFDMNKPAKHQNVLSKLIQENQETAGKSGLLRRVAPMDRDQVLSPIYRSQSPICKLILLFFTLHNFYSIGLL